MACTVMGNSHWPQAAGGGVQNNWAPENHLENIILELCKSLGYPWVLKRLSYGCLHTQILDKLNLPELENYCAVDYVSITTPLGSSLYHQNRVDKIFKVSSFCPVQPQVVVSQNPWSFPFTVQWLYVGQTPPKIAELSQFARILYTVRTPQQKLAKVSSPFF